MGKGHTMNAPPLLRIDLGSLEDAIPTLLDGEDDGR